MPTSRDIDARSWIALRDERAGDGDAIADLIQRAFAAMAVSRHNEHRIVAALRAAGVLTVSIVAEHTGVIVGHCAASPVTVSDGSGNWYGLGPVSVLPEFQRRGIGTTLVRDTLDRLRAHGACGCVVLGHRAYYERFGFDVVPGMSLDGYAGHNFVGLRFGPQTPRGVVNYHASFRVT